MKPFMLYEGCNSHQYLHYTRFAQWPYLQRQVKTTIIRGEQGHSNALSQQESNQNTNKYRCVMQKHSIKQNKVKKTWTNMGKQIILNSQ